MYCRGEDGCSNGIPKINPVSRDTVQKKASCLSYYCFRIMVRYNRYNVILMYGMLLNQRVVDQYSNMNRDF